MAKTSIIALTNFCWFIIWAGLLLLEVTSKIDAYWKIQYLLISLFAMMYVIFNWQKDSLEGY